MATLDLPVSVRDLEIDLPGTTRLLQTEGGRLVETQIPAWNWGGTLNIAPRRNRDQAAAILAFAARLRHAGVFFRIPVTPLVHGAGVRGSLGRFGAEDEASRDPLAVSCTGLPATIHLPRNGRKRLHLEVANADSVTAAASNDQVLKLDPVYGSGANRSLWLYWKAGGSSTLTVTVAGRGGRLIRCRTEVTLAGGGAAAASQMDGSAKHHQVEVVKAVALPSDGILSVEIQGAEHLPDPILRTGDTLYIGDRCYLAVEDAASRRRIRVAPARVPVPKPGEPVAPAMEAMVAMAPRDRSEVRCRYDEHGAVGLAFSFVEAGVAAAA